VGWEKVACWSTKAAISLKRVKIEEKLLGNAYRNSPTLFRVVPSPTPYGRPFSKIGVRTPVPTQNFKFGQYIQRVHPNKSPLKILEKTERGHIQILLNVFGYQYHLSQERVKLPTSSSSFYCMNDMRAHL